MVAGPVVSTLDDVLPSVGIVVDPSVSPIELEPPSVVLLGEVVMGPSVVGPSLPLLVVGADVDGLDVVPENNI